MKRLASFAVVVAIFASACGSPPQADKPRPILEDPKPDPSSADLDAAHDALEKGDFAAARGKAMAVLDKAPKNAEALFILGNCDDGDKKTDDAIGNYKAALAIDPKLTGASVNLAADLIDTEQYDDAIMVAKSALLQSPQAQATPDLHVNLGYALRRKGDHAGAVKAFGNAVKLQDNAMNRLDHAIELLATGDKPGAQKEFKNALAKAGDDVATMAEAAVGLGQSDDLPGCVAAYDAVVAKKPTAEYLTERAICKHKAKDLIGARKDTDDALVKEATYWKALAASAKYAEEANDKKTCKARYSELLKVVKGQDAFKTLEAEGQKGLDRCSK